MSAQTPPASRTATYGFAALILSVVAILVVPLPPPVLDALLAIDLLGASIVLIVSVTVSDPLDFSAFAPALLLATLYRLALDVSATRLILSDGALPGGAGNLIPAFGDFVVRGNLVVGLIVFAILITIQFVVIASGAQRVAEVAARFTLDAMPGKQMAIDADVHAGALGIEEARRRRELVQKEAEFYGAMDGAGKFIKGDAIAALVIVGLNLIGGLLVGVFYHGMEPAQALSTYALLSIGNALVTSVPAFLLSTAMGLMVTRVAASGSLGVDLSAQVLARPEALRAAGVLAAAFAAVPGFPGGVFIALGVSAFGAAWWGERAARRRDEAARARGEAAMRAAVRKPEAALTQLGVDAVSLDFGLELCSLLEGPNLAALLDRVGEVRRALAAELGVVIPGVRLRDDLTRPSNGYAIRVRDELVAQGTLVPDRLLAVAGEAILELLDGDRAVEPVYGLAAQLIDPADRVAATAAGALVFDPISIVGSHLAEVVRNHAAALLGRQELQTVLEHLRVRYPALIKEVGTDAVPLATVQRVFTALLTEGVWPRDPVAVLDTIVAAAPGHRDPRELIEQVRRAVLPAQIRRSGPAKLTPLLVDAALERELGAAWAPDGSIAPRPELAVHVRAAVERYAESLPRERAIVLCGAALRPALAEFLRKTGLPARTLSYVELPAEIELEPAGVITLPPALAELTG